jgi:hypothetical protein
MEVSRSNMSYKFMDIDINNINYTKTKYTTNKSKIIMLNYNNKPFVIQTPYLLNITNELLDLSKEKSKTTLEKQSFSNESLQNMMDIELALIGREQNSVKKFTDFLNSIQAKIKQDAMTYSEEWFDLKNNNKVNFERIIRTSSKYSSGTIKIKLINNNDFKTVLDTSQLDNNILVECWSKMLLEFYAIRINSKNVLSICLRPISISFKPKQTDIYNKYNFIDDSEIEDINNSDNSSENNNYTEVPLKAQTNKLLNLLSSKVNNVSKSSLDTLKSVDKSKPLDKSKSLDNIPKSIPEEDSASFVKHMEESNNLSDNLSTTSDNDINNM